MNFELSSLKLAISRRYIGDEIVSALQYGAEMRILVIALIFFAAPALADPTILTGTVSKVRGGDR